MKENYLACCQATSTLASNQQVHIKDIINLVVLQGDFHARVTFGAVDTLFVPIFLGTSNIDQDITGIFPHEQPIVPFIHFQSLYLRRTHTKKLHVP